MALVALGDRDDEPQVRVDHPVLRGRVAALDALGQLDLLGRRQQRVPAGLVQEQLQGVGGRLREIAVDVRGVVVGLPAAVVGQRDVPFLELGVDPLELVVVEVELLDQLAELGHVDAAGLLACLEQGLERVDGHGVAIPMSMTRVTRRRRLGKAIAYTRRSMVWEAVFLLVVLKIPIVYLCVVVWWAIRAEPRPEAGAALVARVTPDRPGRLQLARPAPCAARRRTRPTPPSRPCGRPARPTPAPRSAGERRPRAPRRARPTRSAACSRLRRSSSGRSGWCTTPVRIIPIAVVMALVAVRMTDRHRTLAAWAVWLSIVWWLLGMTVAIVTENPLY